MQRAHSTVNISGSVSDRSIINGLFGGRSKAFGKDKTLKSQFASRVEFDLQTSSSGISVFGIHSIIIIVIVIIIINSQSHDAPAQMHDRMKDLLSLRYNPVRW